MRLLQQDAEFAGSTPAGYIRSSVAEHRKSSREKKAADPNFCLRACLVSGEVPDFRVGQRQFFADVLYVPQEKLPKYGAERRVKTVLRKILNRLLGIIIKNL